MKPEIGKTYLREIPHEGKAFDVEHPSFKGTYAKVADQINESGLIMSSSSQVASLVYDAHQNPEGKYEAEIIGITKNAYLWESKGNLYLPKSKDFVSNGVILENNPSIINGRLNMDKSSLIKRLEENDPNVKFVPFGFKTGGQSWKELGKNPYIVARYGEEGAEKIAEVASKYKSNPRLWSFNSTDEEKKFVSSLVGSWYFDGRLVVGGDDWVCDDSGHAFGVKD